MLVINLNAKVAKIKPAAYPNFVLKEDDQLVIVGVVMHIIKTPRR